MRERTETQHTTLIRKIIKQQPQKCRSVSLLPGTFKRNTQSKSHHTEGRGRGDMKEGRKRRLAQVSVVNSHFYRKSTGDGEAGGERRKCCMMHCREEKRGGRRRRES